MVSKTMSRSWSLSSQFLDIIWISYLVSKWRYLVISKWSCKSPQLYWLLNLEWLSRSQHIVQSHSNMHAFLVFVLKAAVNHKPLEYRYLIHAQTHAQFLTVVSNHLCKVWFQLVLSCVHAWHMFGILRSTMNTTGRAMWSFNEC